MPVTHAVVIGAGGLGHIGIQVLKALTASTVTVLEKSEQAMELARDLGADHTVQMTDDETVTGTVDDLTAGGAQVRSEERRVGEEGRRNRTPDAGTDSDQQAAPARA